VVLLTVRVEAVDAMLDLGENATGGIQLANSNNRRYHLRNVQEYEAVVGAVSGEIQTSQSERCRFIRGVVGCRARA
jgi:hypothetical protein